MSFIYFDGSKPYVTEWISDGTKKAQRWTTGEIEMLTCVKEYTPGTKDTQQIIKKTWTTVTASSWAEAEAWYNKATKC